MPRQVGIIKLTGTYGDVTFYKFRGDYYARMKSSLDGKRVLRDRSFANTRRHASQLAMASKMASEVYRSFTGRERKVEYFREMTGMAKKALHKGKSEEEVKEMLLQYAGKIKCGKDDQLTSLQVDQESCKVNKSLVIE